MGLQAEGMINRAPSVSKLKEGKSTGAAVIRVYAATANALGKLGHYYNGSSSLFDGSPRIREKHSDIEEPEVSSSSPMAYRNGWHTVVDHGHRPSSKVHKPHWQQRPLVAALTRRRLLGLGVFAALILLFSGPSSRPHVEMKAFATTKGFQFDVDCRPFYIAGFNAHHLLSNVLVLPHQYKTIGNRKGRDIVREALQAAAASGLNVMRTFAHTTDLQFPFQDKAGSYNENVFRAMDWVLDECSKLGIKVILSFVDNWKYPGGVDEFVDWSPTAPRRTQERAPDTEGDAEFVIYDEATKDYEVTRHTLFFNDTGSRALYRDYVRFILERRNSRNGRLYREDPTIFAWDLINEPRCETWKVPECVTLLQNWVEEMSAFVKRLDPHHLVTIGAEGFWGPGHALEKKNPADWASQTGQNFTVNHLVQAVDFAAIHVWPDNWERTSEAFQMEWVVRHMQDAERSLGKPLLLEEFGKKLRDEEYANGALEAKRDPVYQSVYHIVETAVNMSRALTGSMFWRYDVQVYAGRGATDYGVRGFDSTWGIISDHARVLRERRVLQPPRPECRLGCWVPKHKGTLKRGCENKPALCEAFWAAQNSSSIAAPPPFESYPSEAACCQPGHGAFPTGCSWASSVLR